MNQIPKTQEIIDKVRSKSYRVGVTQIKSGMGFDWVNYAPALFEYRIEMEKITN